MDLYHKRLLPIFLICLVLTLFMPVIIPSLDLFYFVPFLIMMYYQNSLPKCLWASLFCGTIVDIFSSYDRIGIFAMNYTITTAILYKQRENFFSDSLSTLPLMTFFFSIISTLIQLGLLFAFEHSIRLSTTWALHDLILMPLTDAAFSFCLFILPFILFGKPRKKGTDYFTAS